MCPVPWAQILGKLLLVETFEFRKGTKSRFIPHSPYEVLVNPEVRGRVGRGFGARLQREGFISEKCCNIQNLVEDIMD